MNLDMKLDRYSLYLTRYMKKINNINTKINTNNELIKKLLKISSYINNDKINLPNYNIAYIKKLHDKKEHPEYYKLFKKKFPNIRTFKDFILYFVKNQHNIDFTDFNQNLSDNLLHNNLLNDDRKELINIFYHKFISIDIIQELESNDLKHIVIQDKHYKISLYYYDLNDNDIKIQIIKIIKIINLIREINKTYKISNIDFYNIIIFLSNRKKYIFNKTKILSPMNINSGSTLIGEHVSVWRKEELEKVLIHELLHYISVDHNLFINNNKFDDINNIFNITDMNDNKSDNRINESYNETVACIINMCWKSVTLNINLQEIYQTEMKFLLFQTSKIIKFFKYLEYDNISNNNLSIKSIKSINSINSINAEDLFKININQTTSVISYIIIKMMLFYNIDIIMNFINKINIKIHIDNEDEIDEYQKLLNKIIQSKNYMNDLDIIIKIKFKTRFLNKTLRMSVI
jgi:hypothetical protein